MGNGVRWMRGPWGWMWIGMLSVSLLYPWPALAGWVSTPEVLALSGMPEEGGQDWDRIRQMLESRQVAQRLQDLGLSPSAVQERLRHLSPQEIHTLALDLDRIQTGGDSALGVLLTLGVLAALVVLFLKAMGHEVILR